MYGRRIKATLPFSFAFFGLFQDFALVLTVVHWCACLWGLTALLHHDIDCWPSQYGVQDEGPLVWYSVSLYWSTMTITTIGYGDVPVSTPVERTVATVVMLIGGSVYAYVACAMYSEGARRGER